MQRKLHVLLIKYYFAASERITAQMATSHSVNKKGRKVDNIPCNLHLEHLNRRLKGMIYRMNVITNRLLKQWQMSLTKHASLL